MRRNEESHHKREAPLAASRFVLCARNFRRAAGLIPTERVVYNRAGFQPKRANKINSVERQ